MNPASASSQQETVPQGCGPGEPAAALRTELRIEADGTVLVHNLTPIMAELLKRLGLREARGPVHSSAAPPGVSRGLMAGIVAPGSRADDERARRSL